MISYLVETNNGLDSYYFPDHNLTLLGYINMPSAFYFGDPEVIGLEHESIFKVTDKQEEWTDSQLKSALDDHIREYGEDDEARYLLRILG